MKVYIRYIVGDKWVTVELEGCRPEDWQGFVDNLTASGIDFIKVIISF